MKIIVGGHGGHGKGLFCEYLRNMGVTSVSSSWAAMEEAVWPHIGNNYACKAACYGDRSNHREGWAALITAYNTPDLTKLGRKIFSEHMVYDGIRNRDEFYALKGAGLYDLSIWIDAAGRIGPEGKGSCTVEKRDFDMIVSNDGSKFELKEKAENIADALFRKSPQPPVQELVVKWADRVFPDRTITNAIQKLVLEEIPEYLMKQDDHLELADIGILVNDIAHLAGVDLDEAIREKMVINLNRTWEINSVTGLMNHVRGKGQ